MGFMLTEYQITIRHERIESWKAGVRWLNIKGHYRERL